MVKCVCFQPSIFQVFNPTNKAIWARRWLKAYLGLHKDLFRYWISKVLHICTPKIFSFFFFFLFHNGSELIFPGFTTGHVWLQQFTHVAHNLSVKMRPFSQPHCAKPFHILQFMVIFTHGAHKKPLFFFLWAPNLRSKPFISSTKGKTNFKLMIFLHGFWKSCEKSKH